MLLIATVKEPPQLILLISHLGPVHSMIEIKSKNYQYDPKGGGPFWTFRVFTMKMLTGQCVPFCCKLKKIIITRNEVGYQRGFICINEAF